MVEIMRPEFDRDAAQRVKGMAEKQELALRIELRPLDTFPVPGSANFQPAVIRLDIQIIRHPDGLACGVVENCKRKTGPLCLREKPLVDEIGHFVGRGNGGVPQLPQLAVAYRFDKVVRVAVSQWSETGARALQ